jgi:hypothetical protein
VCEDAQPYERLRTALPHPGVIAGVRAGSRRNVTLLTHAALAAVCYLPLVVVGRGRLAADTRQAVYLDPGRFLADALSMWDPSRDLGTVTHQNIVLAWPMGVFYWLAHTVGIPLWFAQRIWTGSILFAAGAGVLYLARSIRWAPPSSRSGVVVGPIVAAFVFAMSPYVIEYVTRTSVLLLPWAALPWLVGLTARALETKGWRHPALFALLVLSIAVNATALVLALVAPAMWIAWEIWGTRAVSFRDAWRTVLRIGALTAVTSLWWVVALLIEGRFGMPILDYTETIEQVAATSSASEVLRGLGYWVPYLDFGNYAEVTGASVYFHNVPVIAVQFAIVLATFVGTVSMRWRHRAFFGALVVVGVVMGVGAYPPNSPSPLSSFFLDFAHSGSIGLALRSTTRAAPMVILGLACLLGAAVEALTRRARRTGLSVAVAVIALAVVLSPSIAARSIVDPLYSRPEEIPDYWTNALATADANSHGTRLLEIPGTRFAAYRWGTTYEPITAGNAATPSAWREQVPYGGPGSADILIALDNRIQQGVLDRDALAPVARLLGVGQILVRNDLEYERYNSVAPDRVWALVEPSAEGLGDPLGFGPVGVNEPDPRFVDGETPRPADPAARYPALALVPVEQPRELVQVVPVAGTVVLDGSGDGIVDAASGGVIDGSAPVLYAATTRTDPKLLRDVLRGGGPIVLTDTNRRRVQRFRTAADSTGITLRADQDPNDEAGQAGGEASLEVFPGAGTAWQTVAIQHGIRLDASRYGDVARFEKGVRPAAAVDGDRSTSWQVGPGIGGVGDELTLRLEEATHTDRIRIAAARFDTAITALDLRFDGGAPVRVALDASSRSDDGQVVAFPAQTFSELAITIAETAPAFAGAKSDPVGISEVTIDGLGFDQVIRLPTALSDRLGASSTRNPLSIVMTRQRGGGGQGGAALFTEEPAIARAFRTPTDRSFSITGTARVSNDGTDASDGALGPTVDDPADGVCRSDLVQIDGAVMPVRLLVPAGTSDAFALESCGAVPLGAGKHQLRTSAATGIDVDQLVLGSSAGGAPAEVSADGRPVVAAAPPAVATKWQANTKTDIDVKAGASDEPTWVLLEQSHNDGWSASSGSGADPTGPVLVNGFANGWYVDQATPEGASYNLNWTPQRAMNIALLVSFAGVLLAGLLVLRGRRWRAASDSGHSVATVLLDAPWGDRPAVSTARVAMVAAGVGLAAALAISPLWGVAVAAIVACAGRWRHGHALLTAATIGALSIALAAVVVDRLERYHATAFGFFTVLRGQHQIALVAVALLAADLLFSRARPTMPPRDPVVDLGRLRSRIGHRLVPDRPLDDVTPEPARSRRRFLAASAAGGTAATALFLWMVTAGTGRLFAWHPASDFYDAQAHSLLAGQLDMPRSVLGIEAFISNGRAYMYQGPMPALVRLPFAFFTDSLDGRLAGLSMLLAFIVAVGAVSAIAWQVRVLFRGATAVGRAEMFGAAAFVFACTAGSIPLFLASQTYVYHESAIWGLALGVTTLSVLVRHLTHPTRWTLVVAAVLTLLTLWSRASIGVGSLVALGLVFVAETIAWLRIRSGHPEPPALAAVRPPRPPSRRLAGGALVACILPVLLYAGLNLVKFGTVASVPWEDQVYTSINSHRREFLAANDGGFFGLQFAPTTVVEYLRPDAFERQAQFPWLGFRTDMIGRLVGYRGTRFDSITPTGSIPVSFPLLCALSAAGLIAIVAARRRRPRTQTLWILVAGAATSAATIFVFGFIAHRYLADVWPLLALVGTVGFTVACGVVGRSTRRGRAAIVSILVALALLASWVTVAESLWFQRVYATPGDDAETTAAFFDARDGAPTLPVGSATSVSRVDRVPADGHPGDVFVVGDCDGLYVSNGATIDELVRSNSRPIVRTAAVGAYDLDVRFPDAPAGTSDPLLVGGTAARPYVLSVEYLGDGDIRFRETGEGGSVSARSDVVHVTPGARTHLKASADPNLRSSLVTVGDRVVLRGLYEPDEPPRLGVNDIDGSTRARFGGQIDRRPVSKDLCRAMLAPADDQASGATGSNSKSH